MTWIKLDDNAVDHPKVASLTDRAFRWWVKALSYASRLLTDGLLPPTFWKQVPKQTRSELTSAQLWDWDDPNFRIHDYLSHQTSREAVDAKRAQTADRVRKFREGKRNGVTHPSGNALQPRISNAPVTLPDTDTETETETHTETEKKNKDPRASRFELWWAAYPKKTGKAAAFKSWSKIDPSAALTDQMLVALNWQRNQPQWAKDGGVYVPNPATYLNQGRWEDEPFFTQSASTKDDELMARLEAIERGEAKH